MTSRDFGEQREAEALPPRQRSARTDPAMRDGDSGHGNPSDEMWADFSTDADTGDAVGDDTTIAPEEMETGPGPSITRPRAEDARGEAPFNDYDGLTIPVIRQRINHMSQDDLRGVAAYERTHRGRKSLLAFMNRRLNAAE